MMIFEKIAINIIYMLGGSGGKKYLIIKKENLIGWLKARALTVINLTNIIKFL